MADKKLTDLPLIPSLNDTTLVYVVDNNISYQSTIGRLRSGLNISQTNGDIVYTTGIQTISGNKTFNGTLDLPGTVTQGGGGPFMIPTFKRLLDDNGVIAIEFRDGITSRILKNDSSLTTLNWQFGFLNDSNGRSIDWLSRFLVDVNFVTTLDWNLCQNYDKNGNISSDWDRKILSGLWTINSGNFTKELKISGNSVATGSFLRTGITSLNSLSGGVNLIGNGGINISTNGQNINISGNANRPSVNFSTNIDWSLANTFHRSLTGVNTFTFSNNTDGQSISVLLTSTGATGVISWPNTVHWPNNITPVVGSGKTDVYTFIQITTGIYATVVQNFAR